MLPFLYRQTGRHTDRQTERIHTVGLLGSVHTLRGLLPPHAAYMLYAVELLHVQGHPASARGATQLASEV